MIYILEDLKNCHRFYNKNKELIGYIGGRKNTFANPSEKYENNLDIIRLLRTTRDYIKSFNRDICRDRKLKEISKSVEDVIAQRKKYERFNQRMNRIPKFLRKRIISFLDWYYYPIKWRPKVIYTDTNGVRHNLTEMQ